MKAELMPARTIEGVQVVLSVEEALMLRMLVGVVCGNNTIIGDMAQKITDEFSRVGIDHNFKNAFEDIKLKSYGMNNWNEALTALKAKLCK